MTTQFYTYQQAANRLGISYRLVQRYVKQGRLGKKLPSGYIITSDDLARFEKIPRKVGRPSTKEAE